MSGRRRAAVAVVLAAACGGCAHGAAVTLYSENDVYAEENGDRFYTNGMRLSGMHAPSATPDAVRRLADALPSPSKRATSQIGWVVGQDMYTPSDTSRDPPDPSDRPYGGWLYAGVLAAKAVRDDDGPQGDRVHVVEVDAGVIGPPSLADQTQVSYHHLIGVSRPEGWDHQIRYEPGLLVRYEHRRRLLAEPCTPVGAWDLIGTAGVSLGNVSTNASAGALVRWGNDLRRDFGPSTIHTTAVDVPDGGGDHGFRAYVFAGVEGTAVGRNVFLDGNTFRDSAEVDSKPLVGELRTGVAIEWRSLRLAYTHVARTREFDGQEDDQKYGSIALTWQFRF